MGSAAGKKNVRSIFSRKNKPDTFPRLYAADQKDSFERGFLHLGMAVLPESYRSRGSLISGSK
jgi:hypothetical protein